MTWHERRRGWIARDKAPAARRPEPVPAQVGPVVIPDFPTFSPSALADLLGVYRSNVQYWMDQGKLAFYRDNVHSAYILRAEVLRFVREFLQREVHDGSKHPPKPT